MPCTSAKLLKFDGLAIKWAIFLLKASNAEEKQKFVLCNYACQTTNVVENMLNPCFLRGCADGDDVSGNILYW